MPKPNDLHHLAIATGDIKTQIEFFSDVLGMELVALYWMHGADGCFHGFLKLHDKASVAFVQTPDNHKIPAGLPAWVTPISGGILWLSGVCTKATDAVSWSFKNP